MWVAKIRMKHDCIIGNRCKEFNIIDTGISFNIYQEKGVTYSPQIHTLHGDKNSIAQFLKDIKKDKRIRGLEVEGDSFFCIEARKEKVPSTFKTEKIIFVKPVIVDNKGYETWEVASWQKDILMGFIGNLKKEIKDTTILKIIRSKLTDVYYPHLMPKLSVSQKRAVELAFEKGYYDFPKRIKMEGLAKLMNVSTPTFCEHLNKAEKKLMPDVIGSIE